MLFAKMSMKVDLTLSVPMPGATRAEAEAELTPEKKAEFAKLLSDQFVAKQDRGVGIETKLGDVDLEFIEV